MFISQCQALTATATSTSRIPLNFAYTLLTLSAVDKSKHALS